MLAKARCHLQLKAAMFVVPCESLTCKSPYFRCREKTSLSYLDTVICKSSFSGFDHEFVNPERKPPYCKNFECVKVVDNPSFGNKISVLGEFDQGEKFTG